MLPDMLIRATRHTCPTCSDVHLCTPRAAPVDPDPGHVEAFISSRLKVGTGWTQASVLHDRYRSWIRAMGYAPVGMKLFVRVLRHKGIACKKDSAMFWEVEVRTP